MKIGTRLLARTGLTVVLLTAAGLEYSSTRGSSAPGSVSLTEASAKGRSGRRHRTRTTSATTTVTTPPTVATTTPPVTPAPPASTAPSTPPSVSPTTTPPGATTVATTAPPASTTPTTPATTTPGPAGTAVVGSGCVFKTAVQPVSVAFCDGFDTAKPDPATRSGDLDAVLWGVSRAGTHANIGQGELNNFYPATLVGCGAPQKVLPPNDVRICNGRLLEAFWDNHQQQSINIYPKQPFDISGGRTGTVVFDVSADSEEPHSAWPEFWWTDKPVPSPHADISGHAPYARQSFGFSMAGTYTKAPSDSVGNPCGTTRTTIDRVMVTRNYERFDIPFTSVDCVTKGSATGALNHFEVKINVNRVEIYAADAGSTNVRLIAFADGLGLGFTKGLIWMEHLSYNACKLGRLVSLWLRRRWNVDEAARSSASASESLSAKRRRVGRTPVRLWSTSE